METSFSPMSSFSHYNSFCSYLQGYSSCITTVISLQCDACRELYDFQNIFHIYFLVLPSWHLCGEYLYLIRKLRPQDCKWGLQGLIVSKWRGWKRNLELLGFSPLLFYYNLLPNKPHTTSLDVLSYPLDKLLSLSVAFQFLPIWLFPLYNLLSNFSPKHTSCLLKTISSPGMSSLLFISPNSVQSSRVGTRA